MNRLSLTFTLALILALALLQPIWAAERAFGSPEMILDRETEMNGRKVLRYEHDSIPEWGYATPQRDYFYVLPLAGNPPNRPLHVVLHSAGHSGDRVLADAFKFPGWFHYAGLDDQIILYLDCRKNKHDWWWGAEEIKRDPTRYHNHYTPTEKRVLTTIEWAIETFQVDRNRVYLSGISMGGSGSLGIGMARGDIFAAVNVAVPAGIDHLKTRFFDRRVPDPPILINYSAPNDSWSRGQEHLITQFRDGKYALIFAWGPHGHNSSVAAYDAAALNFPWRAVRKDQAYPVFTNTSTDQRFPGYQNALGGDPNGQIGALFRWKAVTDEAAGFAIELRLVTKAELPATASLPASAQSDVSVRRLQNFRTEPDASYSWTLTRDGQTVLSGKTIADQEGLVTVPKLTINEHPATLSLAPWKAIDDEQPPAIHED